MKQHQKLSHRGGVRKAKGGILNSGAVLPYGGVRLCGAHGASDTKLKSTNDRLSEQHSSRTYKWDSQHLVKDRSSSSK